MQRWHRCGSDVTVVVQFAFNVEHRGGAALWHCGGIAVASRWQRGVSQQEDAL
jgi:hypothetical protein